MFRKFLWPGFKPFLKDLYNRDCNCGGTALSIITGIRTKEIHKIHPSNDDWTVRFMLNFLKKRGYDVLELNYDNFGKRRGWKKVFSKYHLILAVLFVNKKEATWVIIYKNKIYHVGNPFKGMDTGTILLNFPIEDYYLIKPKKCK